VALLTSQSIAALNVGLLTRQLVLPMTVARIAGGEFAGNNGDTITVRVPQPGVAREQATPGATITYDDVTEAGVDVSLAHLYHAKRITDEELSLEVIDFGAQISAVQVAAVATGAEDQLAAAMNALAADDSIAANGSDVLAKIIEARGALGGENVPAGDRFLAVSPDVAGFLLSEDKLTNANQAGSDSALREATLGRLFGFTVVESNGLAAGTAVAYHRTGFAFANRVPVTPRGAADSSTATAGGVGMRHIFQYQPDILSDASVVSTFAGAAVVDADRVFKLTTAA
jgi:hypothetical protein